MVWESERFWNKACLYERRGLEDGREAWERPFWSALALEFLARAVLTKIHPALNADPQNELNLFYSLGYEIKGQPRSLPIHSVLPRLERLVDSFDKPTREFCEFFVIVRNREMHTAELAFQGLAESKWLPRYYRATKILCEFLERDFVEFVGAETVAAAEQLIDALESDKRSEVLRAIAAHRAVFEGKAEDERLRLATEQQVAAAVWLDPHGTIACPSCGSIAKLTGDLERETEPMFQDGALIVEETYLASRMECGACELVLRDIQEIHHAGLEPHFRKVVETDLHAYFEAEYYDEYNNM